MTFLADVAYALDSAEHRARDGKPFSHRSVPMPHPPAPATLIAFDPLNPTETAAGSPREQRAV